jgi:hypothetical protein
MRLRPVLLAIMSVPLAAQQSLPVGIVHGRLLALVDHPAAKRGLRSSGEFTLESADGNVYGCEYDSHTLFERNRDVVRAETLRPGDPVEVVSDRKSGGCYTRMLSVTYAAPLPRVPSSRNSGGHLENLPMRGYLTVSGLVVRSGAESITIRTRSGEATLLLRADTRYSDDGVRLDSAVPLINKHVFVRAGRSLDGTLEAYQVMWGDVLLVP